VKEAFELILHIRIPWCARERLRPQVSRIRDTSELRRNQIIQLVLSGASVIGTVSSKDGLVETAWNRLRSDVAAGPANVVQRHLYARSGRLVGSRKQENAAGIGLHRQEGEALPVEHEPACEGNENDGRSVYPSAFDEPVWNGEGRTRAPWPGGTLGHPLRQARTRRIRRRKWTSRIGTVCL
jgi:hypothetical protein